ncbi:MAG: SUMF1/EgtB/PvdO family nonheme iron enzyme [Bythopirellula sp.]|nr:SUMF1/EgtB/PvdO family nonheme iron enzyme [Bythopirellula sp.]
MKNITTLALLSLFLLCCSHTYADTFGNGANEFDVEFVTIGNPGNAPDTTGDPNPAGSVPYTYRIGKYEISEQMIDKANALSGLGITKDTRGPDMPATSVRWDEAARFVNWLNISTGSTPAYKFSSSAPNANFQLWDPADAGYNPNNEYRNSLAKYFLPSVDEWYKAAYYNPIAGVYYNYPTGSDIAPIPAVNGTTPNTAVYDQLLTLGPAEVTLAGGLSPYGTMAQGGNVQEWDESFISSPLNGPRGHRGGSWFSNASSLSNLIRNTVTVGRTADDVSIGFRVASIVIPEPSSMLLSMFATLALLARNKRLSFA